MKTLNLNKVNLNSVRSTTERFLLNNQYRLPICIDMSDRKSLLNTIIGVLENSDFRFVIKDSDIIVLE